MSEVKDLKFNDITSFFLIHPATDEQLNIEVSYLTPTTVKHNEKNRLINEKYDSYMPEDQLIFFSELMIESTAQLVTKITGLDSSYDGVSTEDLFLLHRWIPEQMRSHIKMIERKIRVFDSE